jgi:Flp pilus assembly protein CpaB
MRNSGLLWWISAFILAAAAGILTYGMLNSASPVAAGSNANMTPVVVAAVNIPMRRSITEDDVVIKNLPTDSLPEGTALTIDQVIGKMPVVDFYTNEPVLTQHLVTPDVVTQQVALSVPNGKVVISVPTLSKLISHRLVKPGDHIDLMATFEFEIQRQQKSDPLPVSMVYLQDLEIHAIILPATSVEEGPTSYAGQEGGVFRTADQKGQSILLAVDSQDALGIHHILDTGGSIDLSLRPTRDETIVEVEPVDAFYLADRFNIDLDRR